MRIRLRLRGWGGAKDGGKSFIGQWPVACERCFAFVMPGFVLGTFIDFLFYVKAKRTKALETNTFRSKSGAGHFLAM